MKVKELITSLQELDGEVFVNTKEISVSGEVIQCIESISEGEFGIYINLYRKEK